MPVTHNSPENAIVNPNSQYTSNIEIHNFSGTNVGPNLSATTKSAELSDLVTNGDNRGMNRANASASQNMSAQNQIQKNSGRQYSNFGTKTSNNSQFKQTALAKSSSQNHQIIYSHNSQNSKNTAKQANQSEMASSTNSYMAVQNSTNAQYVRSPEPSPRTHKLPDDLQQNPNFLSDFYSFDKGAISVNDFFMKNIQIFKRVYKFTSSHSIDILSLSNEQISAIIIVLYNLSTE